MRKFRFWRPLLAGLSVLGLLCVTAPAASASAANEEPMWIFEPVPPQFPLFEPVLPPPVGYLYGPCGAAVDSGGNFYISDYYHHAVDVWSGEANFFYGENQPPPNGGRGYIASLLEEDPADGPCGLALDASDNLYINNYHRNVVKFGPKSSFGSGTIIAGQGIDATHPTGVDVDPANGVIYVDSRTYVAAYHTDGTPVMDGLQPLRVGAGSLENGYGIAYSRYPGTLGRLYVPDAATNTIKIYNPAADKVDPVAEIDGSDTPNGKFLSLRDASITIDRVSGEIYVVDNLQPKYAEAPNAVVYVFEASGAYEGHLKYNVGDALPVGLAVDNSAAARDPSGTQGRVYVTSGNTEPAVIYGYHADAATTEPFSPGVYAMSLTTEGTGGGSVSSSLSSRACTGSCQETVHGGARVTLTAEPDRTSSFTGWSGACSGTDPTCTLKVEEEVSAHAQFTELSGLGAEDGQGSAQDGASPSSAPSPPATSAAAAAPRHRRQGRHHHRHGRRSHRAHRSSGNVGYR